MFPEASPWLLAAFTCAMFVLFYPALFHSDTSELAHIRSELRRIADSLDYINKKTK